MIARVLDPSEWGKLADTTKLPQIGPTMRPEDVKIIAVQDGDQIVATMAVLRVVHLESLWISPTYRGNASLGRQLIRKACELANRWTDKWVWGASDTPHMTDIIKRVGGIQIPVESFMIPVGRN